MQTIAIAYTYPMYGNGPNPAPQLSLDDTAHDDSGWANIHREVHLHKLPDGFILAETPRGIEGTHGDDFYVLVWSRKAMLPVLREVTQQGYGKAYTLARADR